MYSKIRKSWSFCYVWHKKLNLKPRISYFYNIDPYISPNPPREGEYSRIWWRRVGECFPFDLVLYIKTKIKTVFKMGKKLWRKQQKLTMLPQLFRTESHFIYIRNTCLYLYYKTYIKLYFQIIRKLTSIKKYL